jgi:hypothetical protein
MLRSLGTFVYGVIVAALVVAVAVLTAIYIIGVSTRAALFGEPRITLATRIIQRMNQQRKKHPTDITHITPNNREPSDGEH